MKHIHTVTITVFCKEEENKEKIEEGLLILLGRTKEELSKEKIFIESKNIKSFEEKTITILSVTLTKERHTNAFLSRMNGLLTPIQKKIIIKEVESRLDEEFFFYIRFDKQIILRDKKLLLTDRGNCYHIKMSIAAFPKKRDVALGVVKSIFSEHLNNNKAV